jgi:hypothetical protein
MNLLAVVADMDALGSQLPNQLHQRSLKFCTRPGAAIEIFLMYNADGNRHRSAAEGTKSGTLLVSG